MGAQGTAILDFGAFPGASDAAVAVIGQAAIVSGSLVEAWIRPEATADHTADEHMMETLKVFAGNIIAGTGFTIYGLNTSQLNEPVPDQTAFKSPTFVRIMHGRQDEQANANYGGGTGTRIWGRWTCAWVWN